MLSSKLAASIAFLVFTPSFFVMFNGLSPSHSDSDLHVMGAIAKQETVEIARRTIPFSTRMPHVRMICSNFRQTISLHSSFQS